MKKMIKVFAISTLLLFSNFQITMEQINTNESKEKVVTSKCECNCECDCDKGKECACESRNNCQKCQKSIDSIKKSTREETKQQLSYLEILYKFFNFSSNK